MEFDNDDAHDDALDDAHIDALGDALGDAQETEAAALVVTSHEGGGSDADADAVHDLYFATVLQ